ncbi:MAG: nuclear transport factor 2 family protein [Pseudomonadota bacterium]
MDRFADPENDLLIRRYLNAFSSGDPEQVAACVTEDFINQHLGMLGGGCTGRDAYLKRLGKFLTDFAALRYDVLETCAHESHGSARYLMHFRQGGAQFEVPGMMWFAFKDGAIAQRTDCWDGLVYLKQAGTSADDIAALLA